MDKRYVPKNQLNAKALGVIGTSDTLCSVDDMNSLLQHYRQSNTVLHKYGHVIPTHGAIKEAITGLMA